MIVNKDDDDKRNTHSQTSRNSQRKNSKKDRIYMEDDQDLNLDQLTKYKNPITGIEGSKISSKKIGQIWLKNKGL